MSINVYLAVLCGIIVLVVLGLIGLGIAKVVLGKSTFRTFDLYVTSIQRIVFVSCLNNL